MVWTTDILWYDFQQEDGFYPQHQTDYGAHPASLPTDTGRTFSWWVRWPRQNDDNSLPSSAKVINVWSHMATHHRHRFYNFSLFFKPHKAVKSSCFGRHGEEEETKKKQRKKRRKQKEGERSKRHERRRRSKGVEEEEAASSHSAACCNTLLASNILLQDQHKVKISPVTINRCSSYDIQTKRI